MGCPGYPDTYLSIEEYWEYLQINEIAGYGIRNFPTTGKLGMGCGDYWDYQYRYYLLNAIQKAEKRLESDRWLGFPLRRKYISGRQFDYRLPISLGKWVRGVGVETNTLVSSAEPVTLSAAGIINDPVTLTVAVTFTDEDELIVCFPGTMCKIRPSEVSISGGVATILIPRARLLKSEYHKDYQNVNDRPNYQDDSYFLDTVDIYRNYLNTSTGANLVWWRYSGQIYCNSCVTLTSCGGPTSACADVRQLACAYVSDQRMGVTQFEPATYSAGFTTAPYAVKCRVPDGIEVAYLKSYYDRYEEWDSDITRAVIAIAHNNMPQDYCNCSVQTKYYKHDVEPIEPAVRLGLGASSWGNYEAEQIIREFDRDRNPHRGGLF